MNNEPSRKAEPVAWMLKKELQNGLDDFFEHSPNFPDWQVEEFKETYIPLYTHPAKTLNRELLDKTIIDQQNEIKILREQLRWALIAKEDVGHNFNMISLQLQQKAQEK